MIYRVRFEGGSDNAETLEREFSIMSSHLRLLGYYEGITGPEDFDHESVIESRKLPREEVELNGRRFSFRWTGRHSVGFVPEEFQYDALRPMGQEEYVAYARLMSVGAVEPELIEQHEAIVLQRLNGPVHGGEEVADEQILDNIRNLLDVREVNVQALSRSGEELHWSVAVEFNDRPGISVRASTLRKALLDAYHRCEGTFVQSLIRVGINDYEGGSVPSPGATAGNQPE